MVLQMRATRWAAVVTTAMAVIGLWPPASAVAQNTGAAENATPAPADDRVVPQRAHQPARIRVHPLAQSNPGPDAVRQCSFRLAPEYRPSGTVIVPQMHCWWERG